MLSSHESSSRAFCTSAPGLQCHFKREGDSEHRVFVSTLPSSGTMSAEENVAAAEAATAAQDTVATGPVEPETPGAHGNSGVPRSPYRVVCTNAPHPLGIEDDTDGNKPTSANFAAGAACVSDTCDRMTSTSVSAPGKDMKPAAAKGAVQGHVESQKPGTDRCAHVDTENVEDTTGGADSVVHVAIESAHLSRYGDQQTRLESTPDVAHCDSFVRPVVNYHVEDLQPELCSDAQDDVVDVPSTCEEVCQEGACSAEGSAVAASGEATATSAYDEGALAKEAFRTEGRPVRGGQLLRGDETMVEHAMVEPFMSAAGSLYPKPVNEELEACKQQLQEMKACLDALWNQKEAFRHANERLSRAVGRLQGQDIGSWQSGPRSSNLNPPVVVSSADTRSPGTHAKQTPPRLSLHKLLPAVSGGADAALDAALSRRSARLHAGLPVTSSASIRCGQAVFKPTRRQGSGSPLAEHCRRRARCERKASRMECNSSDVKKLQTFSSRCNCLCPKAARRNSSSFGGDDQHFTYSSRHSRAPTGVPASAGLPPTPRPKDGGVKTQPPLPQTHHGGLSTTQFPSNSRRSLPPVPRLDLQCLLQAQQRGAAGPASSARGSAGRLPYAVPDLPSVSRRGRRQIPSIQRSVSRSSAGVEADEVSVSFQKAGISDETESLSARRESLTTQDSSRGETRQEDKREDYRQARVRRCVNEDGGRSRQSSLGEGSRHKETVAPRKASAIVSGFPALRIRKDSAFRKRQSDVQSDALPDNDVPLQCCGSGQVYRQRSVRRKGQRFDTYAPLQHRPVCAASGGWRPLFSMRSTIGGLGQKERAAFSARPSLAETAMKTPRTCFLDDRIVRAPHLVQPLISAVDNSSPVLHPATIKEASFRKTARGGASTARNIAESKITCDKEVIPTALEEQLATHVRHCMELLQCTEANREDDFKTSNVPRPVRRTSTRSAATRPTLPLTERSPRKEEGIRERGGRHVTTDGSPVAISSPTLVPPGACTALETGEDSILQACVRKPRDGYWHVIYTCVIKVRGTDFFLDARFSGETADVKACEAAQLVASKERAGVFKVCIRHLLRSTRDFFDSARVLWWQPLPVVCSDEWLPYDEVMRCRAEAQIRALRAKCPALAAAARERESRKASTGQAAGEGRSVRTVNAQKVQGAERSGMDGRNAGRKQDVGRFFSSRSSSRTKRTARQGARMGGQVVCPGEAGKATEASPACSIPFHRGAATERSYEKAASGTHVKTGTRAAMDAKEAAGDRSCPGSLQSVRGDCVSAGESRMVNKTQKDSPSADQTTTSSSSLFRIPPRHDSEWDAVGLVYVGSLCAEQPVAQFKRMLGSCGSNEGEAGGRYVSNSKPKPRCMFLSPSSDISFLLSEPLRRSCSDNTDSSFSSETSVCSRFSGTSCSSRNSDDSHNGEIESISETCRSRITAGSHNTEDDSLPTRQEHDDPESVLSQTPRARSLRSSTSTAESTGQHYDSVRTCTRISSTSATNTSDICITRGSSSSNSSATDSSMGRSSSVTTRSNSGAVCRDPLYSKTLVGTKPSLALVPRETTDATFDRSCQLSLSRKLGPQELFIVRRRDREDGCFPLYHHFSGRYLCVHPTNGLIGMVCANATPAAAAAARAVQKEMKASCRYASERAPQARSGPSVRSSAFDGCVYKHRRQHRKSEDCVGKTTSEKSSKAGDQLTCDIALVENTEKTRPATTRRQENKESMPAEKGALPRRLRTETVPPNTDWVFHRQQQSSAAPKPLAATVSDSCASATPFLPSPFYLSSLTRGTPAFQLETLATPCSSHGDDARTKSQEEPSCESIGATQEGGVSVAHTPGGAHGGGPAKRAMQDVVTSTRHSEEEGYYRHVTVSAAQEGARKLGALMYSKRFGLQQKRTAKQSDIGALGIRGKPSPKNKSVRDASTEGLRKCTPCADTADIAVAGDGSGVYGRKKLRHVSLEPSFFELVTVSDLLVQQTVARILASVPQPSAMSETSGELRCVSKECAHVGQEGELVDRMHVEADTFTQTISAETSKKKEGHPLTSETHDAADKQEAETLSTSEICRYTEGTKLYCDREYNPDGLVDAGTAECSFRQREGDFAAASSLMQKAPVSRRRSCRYSDPATRYAAAAATSAPPHCFFRASMPGRNGLPARKNNILLRNSPLMLPSATAKSGAAEAQRPLVQDSSLRRPRQVPTRDNETHGLVRLQQKHHCGRHKQCPTGAHYAATQREHAFSAVALTNPVDLRGVQAAPGCEQFSLDECDALTEIAIEEVRASRDEG